MLILPYITLFIGIIWLIKLNPINIKKFYRDEAKRGLVNNFKPLNTKTNKGFKMTLIETNNKVKFIKQQKILRPFQILDDKCQ